MLTTPVVLTSYVIRHTWVTEALRQHVPVALISLGHTSEKCPDKEKKCIQA